MTTPLIIAVVYLCVHWPIVATALILNCLSGQRTKTFLEKEYKHGQLIECISF